MLLLFLHFSSATNCALSQHHGSCKYTWAG